MTIIHSPSDTMKFYEGTPQRLRMQRAPMAASSIPIAMRCGRNPDEEREFPIDDSAGGCDDPIVKTGNGSALPVDSREPAIDIVGFDGVSETARRFITSASRKASPISRSWVCIRTFVF